MIQPRRNSDMVLFLFIFPFCFLFFVCIYLFESICKRVQSSHCLVSGCQSRNRRFDYHLIRRSRSRLIRIWLDWSNIWPGVILSNTPPADTRILNVDVCICPQVMIRLLITIDNVTISCCISMSWNCYFQSAYDEMIDYLKLVLDEMNLTNWANQVVQSLWVVELFQQQSASYRWFFGAFQKYLLQLWLGVN